MVKRMVVYPLFEKPVPITLALSAVASQENNDGPEYDLMVAASEYITFLEKKIKIIQEILNEPVLYF